MIEPRTDSVSRAHRRLVSAVLAVALLATVAIAAPSDPFAGTWAGTGSEVLDDGSTERFPVRVSITRGDDGTYRAKVFVEVRVATEEGDTFTVRAKGTFTGGATDGRLALAARSTSGVVVETGETVPLGPQSLELAKSDGGGLAGRLGNDEEGWTSVTLARKSGAGSTKGGDGESEPEPVAKTEGTMRFRRVTLRDPEVEGLESHAMLVPAGFDVRGGAVWTPRTFRSFNHLRLRIDAPDGRRVAVDPGMMYSYTRAEALAAPREGTIDNGTVVMPVPESIDDYVMRIFLPQCRPEAAGARIVDRRKRPETEERIKAMIRPIVEQNRRSDAMLGSRTEHRVIAMCVRVAYREGGHAYEEDLYLGGFAQTTRSHEMNLGAMIQSLWQIEDVTSVRARSGGLDAARPLLECVRLSVRWTPKYAALIFEINSRMVRKEAAALKRAAKIWIEKQNELLGIHGAKVSADAAARDEAHRKFIDYVRDVETYRTADGRSIAVPSVYDRAYTNESDDVLATNDPDFDDTGWTRMKKR